MNTDVDAVRLDEKRDEVSRPIVVSKTSWVEIITGIGVILSLLVVAVEIRSNTNAVRGATLQAISDQVIQTNLAAVGVPELTSGYAKAMAGRHAELSAAEEDAMVIWYGALLAVTQNRCRQSELGLLDQAASVGPGLRLPYFRAYWEVRRSLYSPDFAEFVEREILPQGIDSIPRVIAR